MSMAILSSDLDQCESGTVRVVSFIIFMEAEMISDYKLRQDVIDELDFEPSLDASHIAVGVHDGVVTLTGSVSSYADKLAAERTVRRVFGVRAIAQEIEIRLPSDKKTGDDEIAKRAADILR